MNERRKAGSLSAENAYYGTVLKVIRVFNNLKYKKYPTAHQRAEQYSHIDLHNNFIIIIQNSEKKSTEYTRRDCWMSVDRQKKQKDRQIERE